MVFSLSLYKGSSDESQIALSHHIILWSHTFKTLYWCFTFNSVVYIGWCFTDDDCWQPCDSIHDSVMTLRRRKPNYKSAGINFCVGVYQYGSHQGTGRSIQIKLVESQRRTKAFLCADLFLYSVLFFLSASTNCRQVTAYWAPVFLSVFDAIAIYCICSVGLVVVPWEDHKRKLEL